MVVDSYCEHLWDPEQDQEKLHTHAVLIRELYAPVTEYTEEEFQQGYALLQLVSKYCLAEKCLSGLQMGEDFKPYWDKTLAILVSELRGCPSRQEVSLVRKPAANPAPVPDRPATLHDELLRNLHSAMAPAPGMSTSGGANFDHVLTVVGNTLQLLSSVIVRLREVEAESKSKSKSKPRAQVFGIQMPDLPIGGKPNVVDFKRASTSLEDVVVYLDRFWKITEKYEQAKKRHGQAEDIIRYIEFKYLRTCLEATINCMKKWEVI